MTDDNALKQIVKMLQNDLISRRVLLWRTAALAGGLTAGHTLSHATIAAATTSETPPSAGTKGQTRGAGGELRIVQWQAPQELGALTAYRIADIIATAFVTEPLLNYLPDGTLLPTLASEVPSLANGLLADDFSSVTYRLRERVRWSDGTPFTAADVVFTWEWLTDPANLSTAMNPGAYQSISKVEAVDDLTVRIAFSQPTPGWFLALNSSILSGIYPAHIFAAGATKESFALKPVGTGPYVVESFTPGTEVIFAANERYRERDKPFFAKILLTGGGDPASAAQKVLVAGTADLAWNVAVEDAILVAMEQEGVGHVGIAAGTAVEQLLINFSDPNTEAGGQLSHWQTPHPILTDKAVRQALGLGTDREKLASNYFSRGDEPTGRVIEGIGAMAAATGDATYDRDEANRLLDDAGWTLDGEIRKKDGNELRLIVAYSQSATRDNVAKALGGQWKKLGVVLQRKPVDPGTFFSSDADNVDGLGRFTADLTLYSNGPFNPIPTSYLMSWYSNGGQNIAQQENGWSGQNVSRYDNTAFDVLYDELLAALTYDRIVELCIQLNDLLVEDAAVIPLVHRSSQRYAIANTLRDENVAAGPFESLYWNSANWNRTESG